MIRVNSIKYSSVKKKKRKQAEEIRLEKDIKTIENEIMQDLNNVSEDKLQKLDQKEERLNDIKIEKLKGVMLRSRSRQEDLGEKTTNYYRNYTS